ncbi:hypothetical protein DFP72DRAFT_827797, partial [Ephemerocybe angulata]
MVGGYTQYLVKVQGMSESTLRALEKAVDDFVYAKKGEKKANAVGIEVLQYPYPDGGLNLLNLRFRNEAAALTNLGEYLKPPGERPFWAYLADQIYRHTAVRRFTNIGIDFLINPFIQHWDVYTGAPGTPLILRRMYYAGRRYGARVIPMEITSAICEMMPYWWHPATKSELVSIYSDKWGRCLRQTHGISTV